MDVASFAGGSVSDSNYVESYLDSDDYSFSRGIPYPMPTNGYFRFAFEEVYGWTNKTVPLEFNVNSVDEKINFWPGAGTYWLQNSGELVKKLVNDVFGEYSSSESEAPSFNKKCLSWMVSPSDKCKIDNGRGGYPCKADGTGYDQNAKCVVYMCDAGYYRKEDRTGCLPIPPTPIPDNRDKEEEEEETNDSSSDGISTETIIIIVVCSVVLAALIVVAILVECGVIRPCCKPRQDEQRVPLAQDDESSISNTSRVSESRSE